MTRTGRRFTLNQPLEERLSEQAERLLHWSVRCPNIEATKAMSATSTTRILIVEDECFLAADLELALQSEGAQIVGPIGGLSEALRRADEGGFDAAVIDVVLHGEAAYSLADVLTEQLIPFVFTTGCGPEAIPGRFWEVTRFEKPYDVMRVAKHVVQLGEQWRSWRMWAA